MKTVFNIVLGLCALALVYICYASIMGPINFEKAKKQRDAAVIARLIDIRKAQLEYRGLHNQQYTASFDTLIDFVKNQKLPFIFKQGELDDKQLEDGLTEKKAINIINKAKKTGNYAEVKKWGLENFKRDTMWVAVLDTIFPKGFNADSMRYVPFGKVYLNGLDKQEIANLKDVQTKLGKYSGLMIGSLETANNNAGNWE